MNKEEFLKAIMELPKVEMINPISTMNSINIDDLMSAVNRLNKVPDYNDLLKENQELKEKVNKLEILIENLKLGVTLNQEQEDLLDEILFRESRE